MDLNYVFVAYGVIAVTSLHTLGAWSLLPGGKHATLGLQALLMIFALSVLYGQITDAVHVYATLATAAPIVAFWILHRMRRFFVKKFGRPPIDTSFDFRDGLFHDRVFNILAALGPMGLICVAFTLFFELFVRV